MPMNSLAFYFSCDTQKNRLIPKVSGGSKRLIFFYSFTWYPTDKAKPVVLIVPSEASLLAILAKPKL